MEGRQPSIEELLNTIQFFKKALKFYGSKSSYGTHMGNPSQIDLDRGHQARFALEQSKNIEKYNDKLIAQSEEMIKEIYGVNGVEEMNKLYNMLKEFKGKQ